ncbi:TIGR02391 family protein [Micromonospora halotolerans]|uniref:TIGR02391 family protein n=1 Tax=Micromonospora halotolerans TaxID=709879 RepID=A0ABY9ZP87_9ACTN|nr:TIGR02391 family protein [Micromonospora halotolerans]WNM37044.1 TIGR02391 family protein [Micromonospora halotolerans]
MNIDWCITELSAYIELADKYESKAFTARGDYVGDRALKPLADELREREPIIQRILNAVQPGLGKQQLIRRGAYGLYTSKGRDAAKYALGYLKRRAEVEANLRSPAPRMSADRLHPWVWQAARTLWETKHYREAVQAASTSLNAHLQELTGRRDVFDSDLITQCFSASDPEPGKPRLRWPGEPTDAEYKAMQSGLRALGQGAFMTIRNRATHDLEELGEHEALERLATLSLLCRWIERCSLVSAPVPEDHRTSAAQALGA